MKPDREKTSCSCEPIQTGWFSWAKFKMRSRCLLCCAMTSIAAVVPVQHRWSYAEGVAVIALATFFLGNIAGVLVTG
ncbi:hypothetical protein [Limnohabitans sp. T6-5]|uniref:hypothetical protein n=1 Tax=Limnohabitans sp. T6-5 TaxID=1100724 RepID=UPI001E3B1BE1|nr:hypothetical protein [Limnohabitans sp. T6-5]